MRERKNCVVSLWIYPYIIASKIIMKKPFYLEKGMEIN